MTRWFFVAIAALAASNLALAQEPAAGEDRPPEILGVRVGFAGHYKPGLWTPVEVLVRGVRTMTCQLALTAPDGDGVPCRTVPPYAYVAVGDDPWATVLGMTEANRITPGGETSFIGYVRFGRVESSLLVELCEGDRVVARKTFEAGAVGPESVFPKALPSSERLVVVVGPDALGVDEALAGLYRSASEHATVAVLGMDDVGRLPARWLGYEGVDAVVLSTGRPEIYRNLKPDDSRIRALSEWVEMGGTLILSVGRNAADLLSAGRPLHPLAPGKFQRLLPLRQATALESYCAGGTTIAPLIGAKQDLRAAQFTDVQGTIEAREGRDLPLVIRRISGFGQVVFTAVDLDLPPVSQWPARPLLVRKLLDLSESGGVEAPQSSTVMHFGFDDMAGQLRSALDQFAGVPPVSFWIVVGVFIAYLLLIGPIDYFLLRKVLRRMELTWITFPPMVLVVCVAAYVAAHRLKGDTLRVNQVDLVDVDCQSRLLRGTTWATLFSPSAKPYDIAVRPQPARDFLTDHRVVMALYDVPYWDTGPLVSWFGLPGSGLGGMASKSASPVTWGQPYAFSPKSNQLEGVPIQVWSTKSLCARWRDREYDPLGLTAELTEQSSTPVGTVTNDLKFPLNECILVYGRWVYELGTLEPGASVSITATQPRRDLRSFLFGRGALEEGDKREASRYDQSSVDVKGILRTMTFFDAAGGQRHTGLANRYQAFVDLSGLLRANRAVLLAEAPPSSGGSSTAAASQTSLHGADVLSSGQPIAGPQDQHVTFYRFVIPVKRGTPDEG